MKWQDTQAHTTCTPQRYKQQHAQQQQQQQLALMPAQNRWQNTNAHAHHSFSKQQQQQLALTPPTKGYLYLAGNWQICKVNPL
jgi:hypothetical protein